MIALEKRPTSSAALRRQNLHGQRTAMVGDTVETAKRRSVGRHPPPGASPWLWCTHRRFLAKLASSLYVLKTCSRTQSSKRALDDGSDCHHRKDQPGERYPRRCRF